MNAATDSTANTESMSQALLRSREHLLRVEAPAHLQAVVMAASAQAMAQRRTALLMSANAVTPLGRTQALSVQAKKYIDRALLRGFSQNFAAFVGGASMAVAAMLAWLLAPLGTAQMFNNPAAASANTAITFTELPGMGGDAAALRSPLQIVPVVLPHAQLSRYGLPFDPSRAALPVRAEMLINAQGQAVAVRFLP